MGRPKLDAAKVAVTLRLDPDVLAAYKAKGPLWRERMAEALERGLAINAAVVSGGAVSLEAPLKELGRKPKPAKASGPEVASEEITPSRAPFKSRLKGEWKAP